MVAPPYAQFTGNEKATREITVGSSAATADIAADGPISTAPGGSFSANLTASYMFSLAGASGTEWATFPVEGGIFDFSRLNADTGALIDQGTGHTDVGGAFYGSRAGLGEVKTIVRIDATDTTLAYEREIPVPAAVPNPTPPAPNAPPAQTQDVYVFSEDIAFSNAHPDLGQTITIFATIHYYGNPPALDIPVAINDIFPVGDMLVTAEIGQTTVSFPDGGADGPAFVIINWTNHLEGAHIIQVAAEPSFPQYTGNDKATRLLFVGAFTAPANNTPPLAQDDAIATDENTPLVSAAPGVLANDVDAELDTLTATVVTAPAYGTLSLDPNGSFTYTPNVNFKGSDSFTYRAFDGELFSDPATVTFTVNPVISPTAVVVVSSANPSTYGQEVAFTANVSSLNPTAGTPNGSVQFQIDGADYGPPVALDGGTASIRTAILAAGPHQITAQYLSDQSEFEDSATAALWIQTVDKASTATTETVSAVTPLAGVDTVTLTAGVAVQAPGSGGPTGAVDFFDTTTGADLGNMSLANRTASFSTHDLAVGKHVIRATYLGNGNFLSSTNSAALEVLRPASLSGTVFVDFNDDGQIDFGEKGIAGVAIALTGTDDLGQAVSRSQLTDADGAYLFLNLRPGSYRITETQPAAYLQGIDTVGTAGGSLAASDQFFIQLAAGIDGLNYNYGERPPASGAIQKGQTATIGFWNNKNGQALIRALNGGTGAELADWLASTLPNIFGVHAGSNNLSGKSNACVAALFQQDFLVKGVKLDAQVLATALAVYATNATLDSTRVAAPYGFTVGGTGLGTDIVNVGNNGDAFGVANNTSMTVLDLLLATNKQAVNGVLYNGNTAKRNEANTVYTAVNQGGDIN